MTKLPPIAHSLVSNLSDLIAMSDADLDIPFPVIQEIAFTQLIDLYEIGNITHLQMNGLYEEIEQLVGDTTRRSWSANTMIYFNILASHIAAAAVRKRREGMGVPVMQ